jgi:hypothetical protein
MNAHLSSCGLAAAVALLSAVSPAPARAQPGTRPANVGVVVDFTVPVRLSKLDRRIRSGMVNCSVVDLKTPEAVLAQGGIGGPASAYFSITAPDGSFSDNVKIPMGAKAGVPPSQYDQELRYSCSLFLSTTELPNAMSSGPWVKPSLDAKDGEMFQVKPGSPLLLTITGNIPAPR